MFFVLVIWGRFSFLPCKKTKIEKHPSKKNCFKKVPGPTIQTIWHDFGHVAVVDCATFATCNAT